MQQQSADDLGPHVNDIVRALEGRVDPEQVEDELRRYLDYGVPLTQAKRDIVRNHGGRLGTGRRKLDGLVAGDSRVDVVAKVLTVNPKTVKLNDGERTIHYGYLADDTKRLSYTAWKDFQLSPGAFVEIKGAYVKSWRDNLDLNLGDYSTVQPTDERFDVVDERVPGAGRAGQQVAVRELRDGMNSVTIVARILNVETKTLPGKDDPAATREIRQGELADGTGRVPFTCWGAQPLTAGAVVRIENGWAKSWRGAPQLNFGDNATVTELPSTALPPAAELDVAAPATIADLAAAGGATGVLVEGVVLDVKPGSGLIFRCTQCKRVLQNRMCRVHGRVEGAPDLRIKAVLDDGHAPMTVFVPREATEKLVGKTLDEAQAMAKEAMTTEVVFDEVAAKMTARRLQVEGNVTSDEFGLQMIAHDARFATAKDVKAEAERLLDELQEVA